MQRQIDILIVVKQIPLFRVIKHILNNVPEVGRLTHMRSWSQVDKQLKAGKIDCFDLVLLDVTEYEQATAIPKLRSSWPAAQLGLLVFDAELVAHRSSAFDVILAKPKINRVLLPWVQSFTTRVSKKIVPVQSIATASLYSVDEMPKVSLSPVILTSKANIPYRN